MSARFVYVAEITFMDSGESIDRVCSSLKKAVAHTQALADDYGILKPVLGTVRATLRVRAAWVQHDADMMLSITKRRLF